MIRACPFTGIQPQIADSAFIDPTALVVGQVRIGERASVFPGTVIRGDVHRIEIGDESNVQDLCCLHVLKDRYSLTLERRVSVGHGVMLHGCVIGEGSLIGMRATVMDGAVIGAGSLVAAGSLVPPGFEAPPNSLLMGSPAKVVRELNASEREMLERTWRNYVDYSRAYIAQLGRGF